ncbi:uncharacterized protein LOC135202955 [Macrobrachium nipponense]|uniref:uncharacterized protein LOC135202955 n=1 Tax=Macrobrachium nipponense TaxID=159736 RepID=UPI0030C7AF80
MITAAQDQALRTRFVQGTIDGNSISPICRKCNTKNETKNHIASECPALAENQYKKRHDSEAKALHWSNKWYDHQPKRVIENEQAKILRDYGIRTDSVIRVNRPGVTLIDKIKTKVPLIDVAIPGDTRVEEKEWEKMDKY